MTPEGAELWAIDIEARQAAIHHKRRAVALVADVVKREGTQEAAGKVLGISKQRVGKILKGVLSEETHRLTRADDEGTETRAVRVVRYGDGAIEVHVSGTTDGAETGPERIEFVSTPPKHEDSDEVEGRLGQYLDGLREDGFA